MKTIFGLDFGTTNSALSVLRNDKIEIVNIGYQGQNTVRSILLFFQDSVLIGEEAIAFYLNNQLQGRFMQSIKSILPSASFGVTEINSRRYTPEELVAIILKHIKARGELVLQQEIEDVVIGRPVIFSQNPEKNQIAEKRLEKAAQLAGFKNVKFQLEPIAAALTYEQALTDNQEKLVLVGDFGGGTSDFSVIRLRKKSPLHLSRQGDVLAVGGIPLAGESLDSQIMLKQIARHFGKGSTYVSQPDKTIEFPGAIFSELCSWYKIHRLKAKKTRNLISQLKAFSKDRPAIEKLEKLIDHDLGFLVFRAIEEAKIRLTSEQQTKISLVNQYFSIKEDITQEKFNSYVQGNVSQISACLDDTVKQSGLTPRQIDAVFITGGTSNIPIIENLFIDRFGQEKIHRLNSFTSVALGLGISANYLFA